MKPLSLLKRSKTFCATHHYRFTEPRERVLSLLIDAHEAMGAYQIIDAFSSDQVKINPPTNFGTHMLSFIASKVLIRIWHAVGTHITPMPICLFEISATHQHDTLSN